VWCVQLERQRMELERVTSALEDARKQVEAGRTNDEVGPACGEGRLGAELLLRAEDLQRLRARRVTDVQGRGSLP
jgi:hypothetical protein